MMEICLDIETVWPLILCINLYSHTHMARRLPLAEAFLTCIQKVSVSNLDSNFYYTDWVFVFLLSHTRQIPEEVPSITLRPTPSEARGGVVVKELRYKPAGRGFASRWCQ